MQARIFIVLLLIGFASYAQNNDPLFSRLQAITNRGTDFFNVDGMEITSTLVNQEFSKKNILKGFKKYGIREEDLQQPDSLFKQANFYVSKSETNPEGVTKNTGYYFVEQPGKGLLAVTFNALNKKDRDFERNFTRLVLDNAIPGSVYSNLYVDSINFVGRKIPLGKGCHWQGTANMQCSGAGQMNWSIHKDAQDAKETVLNQYKMIKAKKNGKIVSEETVPVLFEGSTVDAKRIVYDFTGVSSLLAGMSGGKTLTVYFVDAPVRQQYVSCVMSFWNNDMINPNTGLSPLLEQVMTLKTK